MLLTHPRPQDGLIRLYHWPSIPPELPMALPIPQSSLVTSTGAYRCAVFLSMRPMQDHYFRVEYGLERKKATFYCALAGHRYFPFGMNA